MRFSFLHHISKPPTPLHTDPSTKAKHIIPSHLFILHLTTPIHTLSSIYAHNPPPLYANTGEHYDYLEAALDLLTAMTYYAQGISPQVHTHMHTYRRVGQGRKDRWGRIG